MIKVFQKLTEQFQLMRFAIVGVTAMCVHLVTVLIIVPLGIQPLFANIIGFLIAFQVSYFGHARWTFNVNDPKNLQHKIKFFTVSLTSFGLNEFVYSILLNQLHMNYVIALIMVLVGVAAFTFILSRFWAFRE